MPEIMIRTLEQDQASAWPEALVSSAAFTVLDAWSTLVRKIYGFDVYRFEAVQAGEIVGILTLTHVQHPIFGNYLATAPFGSYGGFAYNSNEARDALLQAAENLFHQVNSNYTVVRFLRADETPPSGWEQHPIYSTYRIDLAPNAEDLMQNFGHQHRKHTRQALKRGFKIRFGQLELLEDAYEGLARSMHELGSPYHSKTYLHLMAKLLGANLEFAVLYDADGSIAGAGLYIFHGEVVSSLHANILRNFRSNYAGEFLYWSAIERYCQMGFKVFDLGRSLIGSGNETFKMKWRPRKQMLSYWYLVKEGASLPELNQKNPKFRLVIKLWQHTPAFLVRWLGPYLINGLA